LKKKKGKLENNSQDAPPNSPQVSSSSSSQALRESLSPIEPPQHIDEQHQNNVPRRRARAREDQENQDNLPKKRGRPSKSR
jgi:hypothetical protein